MPHFLIKTGYRLTVADPGQPGQVLEKVGGDLVELDADTALQYADALEEAPAVGSQQAEQADHPEG